MEKVTSLFTKVGRRRFPSFLMPLPPKRVSLSVLLKQHTEREQEFRAAEKRLGRWIKQVENVEMSMAGFRHRIALRKKELADLRARRRARKNQIVAPPPPEQVLNEALAIPPVTPDAAAFHKSMPHPSRYWEAQKQVPSGTTEESRLLKRLAGLRTKVREREQKVSEAHHQLFKLRCDRNDANREFKRAMRRVQREQDVVGRGEYNVPEILTGFIRAKLLRIKHRNEEGVRTTLNELSPEQKEVLTAHAELWYRTTKQHEAKIARRKMTPEELEADKASKTRLKQGVFTRFCSVQSKLLMDEKRREGLKLDTALRQEMLKEAVKLWCLSAVENSEVDL